MSFFLFLVISCTTTRNVQTEQAEIQNKDGSFLITNRDSNGNPFLTGDIYIANKLSFEEYKYTSREIVFLIYGIDDKKGNKEILRTKVGIEKHNEGEFILEYIVNDAKNKSFKKHSSNVPLSDFETIAVFTANGKLTDADVEVKSGNLYITIKEYDFSSLSSLVQNLIKEGEEKEAAKKQKEQDDYEKYISEVYKTGEKLYAEKVLPVQDKNIPIFINSYDISKDVMDGIDVSISFENIYNKTIKYVDFEVTPYNRVNDVTYSTIDRVSTKTIQVVDFIEPNKSYKAEWKAIWYNPTIAFIEINRIKVTFADNSTVEVPSSNMKKVFKTKELVKKCFENGKQTFVLKYNIDDNNLYAEYNLNESVLLSSIPSYQLYFETDEHYVKGEKRNSFSSQAAGSYSTGLLTFSLSGNYSNYEVLYSVKTGEIRKVSQGMTPGSRTSIETIYTFTEEDLEFIRECVSMRFYRSSRK